MEERITIEWEGEEVEIVIGGLTRGDLKEIKVDSVIDGKEDAIKFSDITFIKSIKKAPFKIIPENVDKLLLSDCVKIQKIIEKLNPFE